MAQASVNLGRHPKLIDRMTAANFGEVFLGIESPDEAALQKAGKHQNIADSIEKSITTIRNGGLLIVGSFIIGMDGEQKGIADRICALIEKTSIPVCLINLMQAIPETALWYRFKKEKRLLESAGLPVDVSDVGLNFTPRRPLEEIQEDYIRTWERLYRPDKFFNRCFNYFMKMRPTRDALVRIAGSRPVTRPLVTDTRTAREKFNHLLGALQILVRFCVLQPQRYQYCTQLIQMMRTNPSRLVWYISTTLKFIDMAAMRKRIIRTHRRHRYSTGPGKDRSPVRCPETL